jgi:hypothetical protein
MPKTNRITSRLAKKKQKQFTKQTIILSVLAVLISVIFLFFLLPNVVKLFFKLFGPESQGQPEDIIPPQQPAVHAPLVATNSAKLTLQGYTEPQAQVHLKLNRQQQAKQQAHDGGEFSFKVKLKPGENQLAIQSEDEAGNQSQVTNYEVLLDTGKPEIKIDAPEDGAEFTRHEDRVIEVTGETEPEAKVYINSYLTYANQQGQFKLRYPLTEGENKLEVEVIDQAGNQNKTELTVKYRD